MRPLIVTRSVTIVTATATVRPPLRHAAQSANRRAIQLRRQAILAKHDAKVAYCELRLATAIIDEMSSQAAMATCTDGMSDGSLGGAWLGRTAGSDGQRRVRRKYFFKSFPPTGYRAGGRYP